MRLIRRLLFVILLLIVGGVVFLSFYKPDWKSTLTFIPPKNADYDCSEILSEVERYDWDVDTAIAVAKAESSCNAKARGDEDLVFTEKGKEYGYSVGAFQVRILPGREKCDSYDIATNVKCAYDLYSDAKGFNDWSMYKNGEYKKYLWRTLDEFVKEVKK